METSYMELDTIALFIQKLDNAITYSYERVMLPVSNHHCLYMLGKFHIHDKFAGLIEKNIWWIITCALCFWGLMEIT